jgi:methylphosphotriester-DNA--protein-cysteine methyltransferase
MTRKAKEFSLKKKQLGDPVVGGGRREVFHRPECYYASFLTGRNRIEFENAKEAREAGMIPCRICSPEL